MENPANGTSDVQEGSIETIDLESKRGVIKMATDDRKASVNFIQFPLSELKVSERDLKYVERNIKVTFKTRSDRLLGMQAFEVAPAEQTQYCAQVYNVAENYCRVLIWESQRLANVDLETLKRVVPHHLSLNTKDCCIVSLAWTELLQAAKEKRLPVVELLELHESTEEAVASLKRRPKVSPKIPPVTSQQTEPVLDIASLPRVNRSRERCASISNAESHRENVDQQSIRSRLGSTGPSPAASSNEIQMAYWSGFRDATLYYQQITASYYTSMNRCCNGPPMGYGPAFQSSRHGAACSELSD